MDEIFEKLADVMVVRDAVQARIDTFELTATDFTDEFDAVIDDTYEDVTIVGNYYTSSYAFKNVCPTDYRLALQEYVDNIDKEDVPAYRELLLELEGLNEAISELEEQLTEETTHINNLTNGAYE
jgi:RNase adaptor protein for sRNA GlmZ degradation